MIYFIGAGPGNVDLITVKGRSILEKADVVIYAGSLVSPEHLRFCKNGVKIYNSASMTLEEVISVMKEASENNLETVRLHTGDPSIYGAIKEQMDELINRYSKVVRMENFLDHEPTKLSGGQKQRVAVARALITHPKIILADEPTGALDSKSTDQLLSIFDQIHQSGQTILMVTHSSKAASYASRVLFIKDGQIFHQLYKGDMSNQEMYQAISDTLTMLLSGGQ